MKQNPDFKDFKSKNRAQADAEFAGSLTPDLDHPTHSKAHPFRYAGGDRAHNAPRGQLNDSES
ncbi:MAG: hypothetical protein HFF18_08915 [Oscillospiraceae bacterium]|nr:hypothetical protein [Oscillospiraceae bacterium]